MKRLSLLLSALLIGGSFSTMALAVTQDQSFTFQSTAGMFEDMYDFFKYSPAYMPGFQKNVFWGQFSNLENSADQQINNGANGSNAYLFGGQMDVMGMGRGGALFDWNGESTSAGAGNFNGAFDNGFVESTDVNYFSSDNNVIDSKTTSYSHVKRVDNQSDNDLYLAYGMGGIAGIDLGASLRGRWWVSNPTYNPFNGSGYGDAGYTFDETTNVRSYNLLSNALTTTFDRTGTGSLSYGNSNWVLDLGGRAKNLMPNLDLVVNLGPVLNSNTNKYTAELTDYNDWEPNNPGVVYNQTVTHKETGIEPFAILGNYYFMPGSGIGFLANARGDYTLNPNVIITGQVGVLTQPLTLNGDAKEDIIDSNNLQQTVGGLLYTTSVNNDTQHKYEGSENSGQTYGKIRTQFLAKGWKLGLGINYANSWNTLDLKDKKATTDVTTVGGTGNLATDYTDTSTESDDIEIKTENSSTLVELPIGVVFNLLENLPLRLGVIHRINYTVNNFSQETTNRTPNVDIRNYADGHSTTNVSGSNTTDEFSSSDFNITHTNVFAYGMSWWPYSNVQIDFTGFAADVLSLTHYNLSLNFYF